MVSQFVNATNNLYEGFQAYDKLSRLGKGRKVLAEIGEKASNIAWIYGKLRSGYTVIDIGLKTIHSSKGLWYGTERIVLGLWKTRNIWKLLYH